MCAERDSKICRRRQKGRSIRTSILADTPFWTKVGSAICISLVASQAVWAQKPGVGGVATSQADGVRCARSMGALTIVEQQAPDATAELPPGLRALMELAARQNGEGASVSAAPLLNLLATQSGCFQVLDRSAAYVALQRERELRGEMAPPRAADWILKSETIYTDTRNSGGGGIGGLGGSLGGAAGIKLRNLEAQVLLTLTDVRDGVQKAVAQGTARRRDAQLLGGGLAGLGVAAIAGSGYSSDIGKVTAVAIVQAYNRLLGQTGVELKSDGDGGTPQ